MRIIPRNSGRLQNLRLQLKRPFLVRESLLTHWCQLPTREWLYRLLIKAFYCTRAGRTALSSLVCILLNYLYSSKSREDLGVDGFWCRWKFIATHVNFFRRFSFFKCVVYIYAWPSIGMTSSIRYIARTLNQNSARKFCPVFSRGSGKNTTLFPF